MTISTTSGTTTLLGNGVTNSFGFNFVVGIASNVNVFYTVSGVQTLLSPSQYTLTLTAPVTGSIWGVGGSVLYPKTGSPIADGTSITITRSVPLEQLISISNQGTLLLSVIETALDTLCLEIQQVSDKAGQILGTVVSGYNYNYGDVVQDPSTLNYYMATQTFTSGTFSTDLANGLWSLAINVVQIQAYATAAAASAAAALVSQGAAASSATASSASAATSTTEAGVATAQAVIATTQAGIATTQATAAGVSASTASTEAGVATTQAGIATTQATASSNSAIAAAASAAAALVSQNAAAASATQAASKFNGTSTTSNTIETGALTFITQDNLGFSANQFVVISANASNYVTGTVTSYNNSTGVLVINATQTLGSGTFASWTINLAGEPGTGMGSVTSVSVTTANGVSGTVATATTTPAISLTLGAITPSSINTAGQITSTVTTGTAPLVIASTTPVANLSIGGNSATVTGISVTGGKTLTISNSLTFSGTDGTTITTPSTSATMARTDLAQTFTGTQTFILVNQSNNAITVTSNAGTCPITSGLDTFTNSSAATMAITIATSGAVDGQRKIVRIYDFSAVAQTIGWTNTENSTISVPTTSNGSTTLPLTTGYIFNGQTSKWRCIASA